MSESDDDFNWVKYAIKKNQQDRFALTCLLIVFGLCLFCYLLIKVR